MDSEAFRNGNNKFNPKIIFLILGIGLLLTIFLSLLIGTYELSISEVWGIIITRIPTIGDSISEQFSEISKTVIWQVRFPRIVTGMLVGAALGAAGVTVQGIFRNPLAEPYTVGVASGAAVGAVVVIYLGLVAYGSYILPLVSFFVAMVTIFAVYKIAETDGKIPVGTLLLAGIAVSLFLQAILSVFMYLAGEELQQMVFWVMGGLWGRNWTHVLLSAGPIILGIFGIFLYSKDLDAMLLGDESAQHLGVKVEESKKILLILSALVTAAAVAVSGVIGFVGLIIPHILRILVGPRHKTLLPASVFGGAIFLVWADNIARVLPAVGEVPVGIITALAGGPFFIYLLKRRKYSY